MKPPLLTPHAIGILARHPDGRVELDRQRNRAMHQQRQMRTELENHAARLAELGELVANINHALEAKAA